jgi:Fe-S cluster assembly protein SufD
MRAQIVNEAWHENNLMALPVSPASLYVWKTQQLRQFIARGFPHRKIENWKYTNVSAIAKQAFTLASSAGQRTDLQQLMLENAHVIVFINGQYSAQLSQINDLPPGVKLTELKLVIDQDQWQQKLSIDETYQTSFSLLNDGLFTNGLFLYLSPGVHVERPIQLIYFTDMNAKQAMTHTRHLIIAAKDSQAVIVEEYVGVNEITYFNNIVTQVEADENANLQLYKLQREGDNAFHIANTIIQQQQNSSVASYHLSVGGKLVRDDLNYSLQQKNAACQLLGFYQLRDEQHIDNHTRIDHRMPQCTSQQNYKGIVDDNAHAVFNGKIIVHVGAAKTNAMQSNKNLLLAKTAAVDTKPELEIYADDVRCTHGATVGQLDPQALFYLRSRGIEQSAAIKMLTAAFAQEFLAAIPHAVIAHKMNQLMSGK